MSVKNFEEAQVRGYCCGKIAAAQGERGSDIDRRIEDIDTQKMLNHKAAMIEMV